MFYQVYGRLDPARPVLLFLHGFLGSHSDWDAVIGAPDADAAAMSDRFTCIAVDLPGHGRSADVPADMAGCSSDMVQLLDGLGLPRFHVVGYSMGARLALNIAFHDPDRVQSVLMESGSPGLRTEGERDGRRRSDADLASRLEDEALSDFVEFWYDQPLFGSLQRDRARLEQMRQHRTASGRGPALAASLRGMGTGSMRPLWEALPDIHCPLHLVVGELDAKFTGIAAEMAAVCPAATVAVVPDCGHTVHAEKPGEFRKELLTCVSKSR